MENQQEKANFQLKRENGKLYISTPAMAKLRNGSPIVDDIRLIEGIVSRVKDGVYYVERALADNKIELYELVQIGNTWYFIVDDLQKLSFWGKVKGFFVRLFSRK